VSVVTVAAILAPLVAACSTESKPADSLRLEGRYELAEAAPAAPYASIWFSRDGRYDAWLAECADGCGESGTFELDRTAGRLRVRATSGLSRELPVALDDDSGPPARGATAPTLVLEPRFFGDEGAASDDERDSRCALGDGTEEERLASERAGSTATTLSVASLTPREGLVTDTGEALLLCASKLIEDGIAPSATVAGVKYDRTGTGAHVKGAATVGCELSAGLLGAAAGLGTVAVACTVVAPATGGVSLVCSAPAGVIAGIAAGTAAVVSLASSANCGGRNIARGSRVQVTGTRSNCTPDRLQQLVSNYKRSDACGNDVWDGSLQCKLGNSCTVRGDAARQRAERGERCYERRLQADNECFGGGNENHRRPREAARRFAQECRSCQ
jgi:hypothetical protein